MSEGSTADARRWAVYAAPPPGHPLALAGAAWLGREAHDPADRRGPARDHVAEPWRYGFHATLKPPMRLATPPEALQAAVAALAARWPAFAMPRLAVDGLDDFLALRPLATDRADLGAIQRLQALAEACVRELDPHRRPPDADELARRRPDRLAPRERELLARWGYPYVLDRWRCHFTLSDGLAGRPAEAREALRQAAREHFAAALVASWACDALVLFVEPSPRAPLVVVARFPLAIGAGHAADVSRA